MTIHDDNPFAEPPDQVRRFRGRIGGAVTLWTAGAGAERAGLTVSSLMVANGDPAAVLALLDPDSDFRDRFEETGLAVVQLLRPEDVDLAEAFAGTAPAPGGPFRLGSWEQADHGPMLADRSHALVRLAASQEVGWSLLVTATIEEISVIDVPDGLEHRRGRYRRSVDPDR
ncbi:MAG TPA: flavin reductase family protein [Marmoricola sp.]|jgi:flavin reductase (DIM6/NTAB) family NADH-FMN oxidoreductase RutF|nr:flavin reductase family protein [Marmoricola sp.]